MGLGKEQLDCCRSVSSYMVDNFDQFTFGAGALAAVNEAFAIWESFIATDVVINLDFEFVPLEGDTIGGFALCDRLGFGEFFYRASRRCASNSLGEEASCLLSGADDAEACKLLIGEDTLSVYVEFGEEINALDDAKATTELNIPLTAIESLEYSEDSRVDVGAVVMLGLPGLLVKKNTATFDIRYTPAAVETAEMVGAGEESELASADIDIDADETAVSEQALQQLLFVMQRGQGRNMRQQLEEATGLTAERSSID